MKVISILVVCLVASCWAYKADVGGSGGNSQGECTLDLFPSFKMRVGESFPIKEGCIQLTCTSENKYEVSSICPSFCQGCPVKVVEHKKDQLAKRILEGRICQK